MAGGASAWIEGADIARYVVEMHESLVLKLVVDVDARAALPGKRNKSPDAHAGCNHPTPHSLNASFAQM